VDRAQTQPVPGKEAFLMTPHGLLRAHRALSALVALGLVLSFVTLATAQAPDDAPPFVGCGKAHALAQRVQHAAELEAAAEECCQHVLDGLREAPEATDVLDCDLTVEIKPGQSPNLIGTNIFTIQSKSSALTTFTFRLSNVFTVSGVLINGVTPVTVTTLTSTTRVVTLDRAYGLDEVFTLSVPYQGNAGSGGFGSMEYTTHGTSTIVYTLSEPYYAYTWWPAKDGDVSQPGDNGDKFTLDMSVISPTGMVTASNGALIETLSQPNNRVLYHWRTNYPLSTYLVCFASTNYVTWSQNYIPLAGGTMPVWFYIYPEDNSSANRTAWEKAVQMITTLRGLFGEYPFVNEKYGIYECEFGGGMEHQTFTAQGTFSESVTVHELSHQWWGDMITCKTWNDIWLNEGFASYAEALWAQYKPGGSFAALKTTMAAKKYTGAGTVYVQNSELSSVNAIFDTNTTYNKAAWVLNMLRHVLGDTGFFQALADYRAAFAFQSATTADFRAVCEAIYGGSLNWFFQEWIYGERTPSYAYGWSTANVAGRNYLLLYIDQTQSAAYQRFQMPLDIVVNGTTRRVFNDADPEWFVIPLPAPATSVQLDPDAWVLTGTVSTTTYVAGPPKVVASAPTPGQTVTYGIPTNTVTVTFHTNVNTTAANYALVGATGGAVPVSFAYNSGTFTTTLTAASNLPPDTYTLTVNDTLTAVNSGKHLDGEVADPHDPNALPSGDGTEGGAATIIFVVQGARGDLNCDGTVDVADINPFVLFLSNLANWQATYPSCPPQNGDINADGTYPSFGDINPFVSLLAGD
jgi:aminopeptidase N